MCAAIRLACAAPEGGMFCWLPLPDGLAASRSAGRALECRLAVVPEAAFHAAGGPDRHLRLCFTTVDPPAIARGLGILAGLLAKPA